jgi:hypothetical protein
MKTSALVVLACLAVIATLGVPQGWDRSQRDTAQRGLLSGGALLDLNTECSSPCRLRVLFDRDTIVDRGDHSALEGSREVRGAFRFWNEAQGSALYVYDEVQNLICRVRNPSGVVLIDPLQ